MNNLNSLGKNLTIRYALLQGMFWISFCTILGFAAIFLKWKHFNTGQIGIILSLASVLSILLQPIIASFADRTTQISLKNITVLIMLVIFFLSFLLFILPYSFFLTAFLYILINTLQFSLPPLHNSMALEYMNLGIPINYGLARGIGSISFAIMSYFLGFMIAKQGPVVLLPLYLLSYVILILLTFTFHVSDKVKKSALGTTAHERKKKTESKDFNSNIFSFFLHYKKFTIHLVGIVLLFACHSMINTYLIQVLEQVGGDSTHLGISMSIAAAVELPTMAMFVYLLRKIKCSALLKTSAFFFVIKTILLFFATSVSMVYVSQVFQLLSYALFVPASVDYVNKIMPDQDKVKGQSFVGVAMMGAGGTLGNIIAGYILNNAGVSNMLFTGVMLSAIGCVLIFLSTESIS